MTSVPRLRFPMLFSLLALTGCTPDTDTEPATAGTTPATDPADPGDWLPTYVPPDLTPAWSADEALAALTSGLALARPDPWQMAAAFDYFLSQGNDWCPGESTILSTEAIEGCAAAGWFSTAARQSWGRQAPRRRSPAPSSPRPARRQPTQPPGRWAGCTRGQPPAAAAPRPGAPPCP